VLGPGDLDYRRPGKGIPPSEAERLIGRALRVAKAAGERLDWADIEL
jgi:sialic acid synthase SpsE